MMDPGLVTTFSFLQIFGNFPVFRKLNFAAVEEWLGCVSAIGGSFQHSLHLLLGKNPKNKSFLKKLLEFCSANIRDGSYKSKYLQNCPTSLKIKILLQLLERQLVVNKQIKRFLRHEADRFRVRPMGEDREGRMYWYFLDKSLELRVCQLKIESNNKETWTLVARDSQTFKKLVEELKDQSLECNGGSEDDLTEYEEDSRDDLDSSGSLGCSKAVRCINCRKSIPSTLRSPNDQNSKQHLWRTIDSCLVCLSCKHRMLIDSAEENLLVYEDILKGLRQKQKNEQFRTVHNSEEHLVSKECTGEIDAPVSSTSFLCDVPVSSTSFPSDAPVSSDVLECCYTPVSVITKDGNATSPDRVDGNTVLSQHLGTFLERLIEGSPSSPSDFDDNEAKDPSFCLDVDEYVEDDDEEEESNKKEKFTKNLNDGPCQNRKTGKKDKTSTSQTSCNPAGSTFPTWLQGKKDLQSRTKTTQKRGKQLQASTGHKLHQPCLMPTRPKNSDKGSLRDQTKTPNRRQKLGGKPHKFGWSSTNLEGANGSLSYNTTGFVQWHRGSVVPARKTNQFASQKKVVNYPGTTSQINVSTTEQDGYYRNGYEYEKYDISSNSNGYSCDIENGYDDYYYEQSEFNASDDWQENEDDTDGYENDEDYWTWEDYDDSCNYEDYDENDGYLQHEDDCTNSYYKVDHPRQLETAVGEENHYPCDDVIQVENDNVVEIIGDNDCDCTEQLTDGDGESNYKNKRVHNYSTKNEDFFVETVFDVDECYETQPCDSNDYYQDETVIDLDEDCERDYDADWNCDDCADRSEYDRDDSCHFSNLTKLDLKRNSTGEDDCFVVEFIE